MTGDPAAGDRETPPPGPRASRRPRGTFGRRVVRVARLPVPAQGAARSSLGFPAGTGPPCRCRAPSGGNRRAGVISDSWTHQDGGRPAPSIGMFGAGKRRPLLPTSEAHVHGTLDTSGPSPAPEGRRTEQIGEGRLWGRRGREAEPGTRCPRPGATPRVTSGNTSPPWWPRPAVLRTGCLWGTFPEGSLGARPRFSKSRRRRCSRAAGRDEGPRAQQQRGLHPSVLRRKAPCLYSVLCPAVFT